MLTFLIMQPDCKIVSILEIGVDKVLEVYKPKKNSQPWEIDVISIKLSIENTYFWKLY